MVVLSEMNNMFWGLTLEPGKKYEQTAERGFHISMACLEPVQSANQGEYITVTLEQAKKSFILCCLKQGTVFQQPLDLNFAEGEQICFFINGKGKVHLTGYMHIDDQNFDETMGSEGFSEDESSEGEDEEILNKNAMKRKQSPEEKKNKKRKLSLDSSSFLDIEAEEANDERSDDDEEDDDDDDDDDSDDNGEDDDEDMDEDDEDDDDDDGDSSEDDIDVSRKSNKSSSSAKKINNQKIKNEMASPNTSNINKQKEAKTPTNAITPSTSNKKKKNKNKNTSQSDVNDSKNTSTNESKDKGKGNRKSLDGGIVVEDIKEGTGTEAKLGKHVAVFYTGKLNNGKIFDQKLNGNPFKFKLGKKEVIAGWDAGLAGMKVGGKRKLIIPPKMGYGSQAAGSIPPNSTLTFEIELKSVS